MTWKPALLAAAATLVAAGCTTPQQTPYASRDVRIVRAGPASTYYAFAAPTPPIPPTPPLPRLSPPLPPMPPMPAMPPMPPLPKKSIDEMIADARAKGHQVIDRTDNGRRTVIITGPGTNIRIERDDSPEGRARAEAAREAGRLAREAGQRAREAGQRAREAGRLAAEEGRRARALALADAGHVMVLRREEIDRLARDARAQGEAARRQSEALRPQIEEIRRNAQRLREQCERGEIKCEIIITEPARP